MSLYNDFRSPTRENVTVDYKTRETDRIVKFKHEMNEYWGTFHGKMNLTGLDISSSVFHDVSSYDELLVNPTIMTKDGMIINLGGLGDEIEEISGKVDAAILDIEATNERIDELSSAIDEVSAGVQASVSSSMQQVTDLSCEIYDNLSCLSGMVSAEADARVCADCEITSLIQALDEEMTAAISSERAERISADESLTEDLLDLSEDLLDEVSNRQAADEEVVEWSKGYVAAKRHYEIYADQIAGLEYPIKSKDFAVNVLTKLTVSEGRVFDDEGILVGVLTNMDKDQFKVTFRTVANLIDKYRTALVAGQSYRFQGETATVQIVETGYDIIATWASGVPSFTVQVRDRSYFEVDERVDHTHMARVTTYALDGGKLLSGYLTVETVDPRLAVFEGIQYAPFDNDQHNIISSLKDSHSYIKYMGDNTFAFCADSRKIERVVTNKSGTQYYIGKIYQTDVVSSEAGLESFKIQLDGFEDVELLSSENFSKDLDGQHKISCSDSAGDFILDYYTDDRYYEYGFCNYEQLSGDELCGTVQILSARTKLSDDFTCSLNAVISDLVAGIKGAQSLEYVLSLDQDSGIWNTVRDAEEDSISVSFDKECISVTVCPLGSEIKKLDMTYFVRPGKDLVYRDDSEHNVSEPILFNFPESEPVSIVYGDALSSQRPAGEFVLTSTVETGDITIQIEDLDAEMSAMAVSRETAYVIKPNTADITTSALVEVKFVDSNMLPVKVFNNGFDRVFVPVNRYSTLQLREMQRNGFLVTDLDQNQQEWKLGWLKDMIEGLSGEVYSISTDLSAAIRQNTQDISAVSSEVNRLCTEISNDISVKYLQLSSEISSNTGNISSISSDIYGEGGISSKVDFLLSVDKDTMNYFGTLPYLDPAAGSIKLSAFIAGASGLPRTGWLKRGDMFKLSADQKILIDAVLCSNYLGKNDFFVINDDIAIAGVKWTDLDIFRNAQTESEKISADLSAVREHLNNLELSVDGLSVNVNRLCSEISNDISVKYFQLSSAISSNDTDISAISSEVNRLCSEISNDISVKYLYLSSEISSNDANISSISSDIYREGGISSKVDFLLSVDKDTMNYFGTLPKYTDRAERLSAFIGAADLPRTGWLKRGDMFKLSAEQSCLYDISDMSVWFGASDYFIINRDTALVSVLVTDLDIFRNAQAEVEDLSVRLSKKIADTAEALSAGILSDSNTYTGYNTFTAISAIDLSVDFSHLYDICHARLSDIIEFNSSFGSFYDTIKQIIQLTKIDVQFSLDMTILQAFQTVNAICERLGVEIEPPLGVYSTIDDGFNAVKKILVDYNVDVNPALRERLNAIWEKFKTSDFFQEGLYWKTQYLSAQLSTLQAHVAEVEKTHSDNIRELSVQFNTFHDNTFVDSSLGGSNPELLKLADEADGQGYKLTVLSGTLVMKKI